MVCYTFHELLPGTAFSITTGGEVVNLVSRGAARRWLDVALNGENAILLCYNEPFRGNGEEFLRRLELLGGTFSTAVTEIREGMTAVLIHEGANYVFPIEGVRLN